MYCSFIDEFALQWNLHYMWVAVWPILKVSINTNTDLCSVQISNTEHDTDPHIVSVKQASAFDGRSTTIAVFVLWRMRGFVKYFVLFRLLQFIYQTKLKVI